MRARWPRLALRSSTSATSEAAMVARSSAAPAARTAMATPSLLSLPKGPGTSSTASVVTVPALRRRAASVPGAQVVGLDSTQQTEHIEGVLVPYPVLVINPFGDLVDLGGRSAPAPATHIVTSRSSEESRRGDRALLTVGAT